MSKLKLSDVKASHHLPQADKCPANLQAITILEDTLQPCLLLLGMTLYGIERTFGQPRTVVLAVCPPHFLPACSLLSAGVLRKKGKLWHYTSSAQEQPKRWCVINAGLVTNRKHSPIGATMKKVNSIPVRPSTVHLEISVKVLMHGRNQVKTLFMTLQSWSRFN